MAAKDYWWMLRPHAADPVVAPAISQRLPQERIEQLERLADGSYAYKFSTKTELDASVYYILPLLRIWDEPVRRDRSWRQQAQRFFEMLVNGGDGYRFQYPAFEYGCYHGAEGQTDPLTTDNVNLHVNVDYYSAFLHMEKIREMEPELLDSPNPCFVYNTRYLYDKRTSTSNPFQDDLPPEYAPQPGDSTLGTSIAEIVATVPEWMRDTLYGHTRLIVYGWGRFHLQALADGLQTYPYEGGATVITPFTARYNYSLNTYFPFDARLMFQIGSAPMFSIGRYYVFKNTSGFRMKGTFQELKKRAEENGGMEVHLVWTAIIPSSPTSNLPTMLVADVRVEGDLVIVTLDSSTPESTLTNKGTNSNITKPQFSYPTEYWALLFKVPLEFDDTEQLSVLTLSPTEPTQLYNITTGPFPTVPGQYNTQRYAYVYPGVLPTIEFRGRLYGAVFTNNTLVNNLNGGSSKVYDTLLPNPDITFHAGTQSVELPPTDPPEEYEPITTLTKVTASKSMLREMTRRGLWAANDRDGWTQFDALFLRYALYGTPSRSPSNGYTEFGILVIAMDDGNLYWFDRARVLFDKKFSRDALIFRFRPRLLNGSYTTIEAVGATYVAEVSEAVPVMTAAIRESGTIKIARVFDPIAWLVCHHYSVGATPAMVAQPLALVAPFNVPSIGGLLVFDGSSYCAALGGGGHAIQQLFGVTHSRKSLSQYRVGTPGPIRLGAYVAPDTLSICWDDDGNMAMPPEAVLTAGLGVNFNFLGTRERMMFGSASCYMSTTVLDVSISTTTSPQSDTANSSDSRSFSVTLPWYVLRDGLSWHLIEDSQASIGALTYGSLFTTSGATTADNTVGIAGTLSSTLTSMSVGQDASASSAVSGTNQTHSKRVTKFGRSSAAKTPTVTEELTFEASAAISQSSAATCTEVSLPYFGQSRAGDSASIPADPTAPFLSMGFSFQGTAQQGLVFPLSYNNLFQGEQTTTTINATGSGTTTTVSGSIATNPVEAFTAPSACEAILRHCNHLTAEDLITQSDFGRPRNKIPTFIHNGLALGVIVPAAGGNAMFWDDTGIDGLDVVHAHFTDLYTANASTFSVSTDHGVPVQRFVALLGVQQRIMHAGGEILKAWNADINVGTVEGELYTPLRCGVDKIYMIDSFNQVPVMLVVLVLDPTDMVDIWTSQTGESLAAIATTNVLLRPMPHFGYLSSAVGAPFGVTVTNNRTQLWQRAAQGSSFVQFPFPPTGPEPPETFEQATIYELVDNENPALNNTAGFNFSTAIFDPRYAKVHSHWTFNTARIILSEFATTRILKMQFTQLPRMWVPFVGSNWKGECKIASSAFLTNEEDKTIILDLQKTTYDIPIIANGPNEFYFIGFRHVPTGVTVICRLTNGFTFLPAQDGTELEAPAHPGNVTSPVTQSQQPGPTI